MVEYGLPGISDTPPGMPVLYCPSTVDAPLENPAHQRALTRSAEGQEFPFALPNRRTGSKV